VVGEQPVSDRDQVLNEQRAALGVVLKALKTFQTHNQTMHLPAAITFLRVAADETMSIGEHARMLGVSQPGMSKLLSDLGTTNRRHKPGLDLIETRRTPMNKRRHEAVLTNKGKALAHTLIHDMRRGLRSP
jgi:DNA-binding MarR family transcriptional regulator